MTGRQARPAQPHLDARRPDGRPRFGQLTLGGLGGPGRVKAPGTHQRLDGDVERPAGARAEADRRGERGGQVGANGHRSATGAAVEFHQVAGVVEQRERGFHPAKLAERRLGRVVAPAVPAGDEGDLNVDNWPTRARLGGPGLESFDLGEEELSITCEIIESALRT